MPEVWTILKVLDWTRHRFGEKGVANPRLDAEVLLAHALGCDRVRLYTHFDAPLGAKELDRFRALVRARLGGEPVAYLVGYKEFWSLRLKVDRRVLIPRPETEILVEAALACLAEKNAPRVADVGTGSGAIAMAIAHERQDASVVATDFSLDAIEVARSNAQVLGDPGESRVEFRHGDLALPLAGCAPLDVIVSNPPYIAEEDYDKLPVEVRREPREALLAGESGLGVIRRLLIEGRPLLAEGGRLILEIGDGQAERVRRLAENADYGEISTRRDLAGVERVIICQI